MHLSNKGNLEGHQQHSPVLCCFSQLFALDSFTLPSHSMSETLTGYSFKKINKMMKKLHYSFYCYVFFWDYNKYSVLIFIICYNCRYNFLLASTSVDQSSLFGDFTHAHTSNVFNTWIPYTLQPVVTIFVYLKLKLGSGIQSGSPESQT